MNSRSVVIRSDDVTIPFLQVNGYLLALVKMPTVARWQLSDEDAFGCELCSARARAQRRD
jgi:hypothetical protein